jgi:hypothetical protein
MKKRWRRRNHTSAAEQPLDNRLLMNARTVFKPAHAAVRDGLQVKRVYLCAFSRSDVDPDAGMANFADLLVSTIAQVEPSEGPFRRDGFPPYEIEEPYEKAWPAEAAACLPAAFSELANEAVRQRPAANF